TISSRAPRPAPAQSSRMAMNSSYRASAVRLRDSDWLTNSVRPAPSRRMRVNASTIALGISWSVELLPLRPGAQEFGDVLADRLAVVRHLLDRIASGHAHRPHAPLLERRQQRAAAIFDRPTDPDGGLAGAKADEIPFRAAAGIQLGKLALDDHRGRGISRRRAAGAGDIGVLEPAFVFELLDQRIRQHL